MNLKKDRPVYFKYAPFISGGVISVDDLAELVNTMKAQGAKNVKLTGETVFVWDGPQGPEGLKERVKYKHNNFRAGGVRPVKMCSAETFCQRYQRPVLDLALEIDRRYHGAELDTKLLVGVAGCKRSCSEPTTKDIGIIAHPQGYEILVGGSAGLRPKIGIRLIIVPDKEEVIAIVGRIIEFLRRKGGKTARLGRIIETIGIDQFRDEIAPAGSRPLRGANAAKVNC